MNPEAQAELDRILALSPAELTESEQEFLQARRSYLTEEQRINFGITEEAVQPEADSMTKAQLQAELTARQIEFASSANKAQLQELLDSAPEVTATEPQV